MVELEQLTRAIVEGDAQKARSLTERAVTEGVDPQVLVNGYMIRAMDEIGRQFEEGDCFVPELLIAARAMKGSLELVRPLLAARGAEPAGRVAIGTVRGDLHDIGKNLVTAMLEGGGFEVIDLGVDVPPEKFIEAAREKNVGIIAMSALLTTTMVSMGSTIRAIEAAGMRERVKIMVGGAPVTQNYANEIRADGYSNNANGAVAVARKLLGIRKE